MKIEELKALDTTDRMYAFDELGDEILALMEAIAWLEGCIPPERFIHPDIMEPWKALNAKLEAL